MKLEIRGKTVTLFRDETVMPETILYLIGEDTEAEALYRGLHDSKTALAVIGGMDWNRDLSPWPSEKVFRGGADFAGKADMFLSLLTEEIIPAAEEAAAIAPHHLHRGIAGYSLAGLFALWSLYQTELFDRAASMSGSLWYDGFTEYAEKHPLCRMPKKLYLSYGEREPKTRNPRMMTVGSRTEELRDYYRGLGILVDFAVHPGGHFDDVPTRILMGLSALSEHHG